MELDALDEAAMVTAARALGGLLQPGDLVTLDGPMGAGKTTFTRALAEGLGVLRPQRVRSPTYNVCLIHEGRRRLAHIDLFRLAPDGEAPMAAAAFEALGLDELFDERGPNAAVVVIEWAQLWSEPPSDRLAIELNDAAADPQRRRLVAGAHGPSSAARLLDWTAAVA